MADLSFGRWFHGSRPGVDEPVLMKLCEIASQETGASVQVANLNAPGQIVLSGNRKALGKVWSWLGLPAHVE